MGAPPPTPHPLPPGPAVSDAERRASGEGWEQTPGTRTRQQTLNTSLLIQFHLYSQTIWQLLPPEVVTFHYGLFFFNVASCLFFGPATSDVFHCSSAKKKRKEEKSHRPADEELSCHLIE